MKDKSLWPAARRGWFGALQCSAKWGDPGNPFSAPAGMLANNVISDPASCSLWFYADQAFWTPELAPGISAMTLVRRTLDWWLDEKVLPSGEVICYWDKTHFLDANAGPLIAAWDYVEATGDQNLAGPAHRAAGIHRRVSRPARCGWRRPGRSDPERQLRHAHAAGAFLRLVGRLELRRQGQLQQRAHLPGLALPGRFGGQSEPPRPSKRVTRSSPTGSRPLTSRRCSIRNTGWLAWWKSEDGELHDYASPVINGLAIEYGLVEPAQGREILARLRKKMQEAGFTRFDLGVPPMLVPVRRGDYLLPDAIGCPQREDGQDTFGYYMNGGITAGQVLHFLAAHYVVGESAQADRILRAMLGRQAQGGFQNGAVNAAPKESIGRPGTASPRATKAIWRTASAFCKPCSCANRQLRQRLYRPLTPP